MVIRRSSFTTDRWRRHRLVHYKIFSIFAVIQTSRTVRGVILTNLILSTMKKFFKFSLPLALPLVAVAAIAWNDAPGPGERTDTLLLPDPEDCSYFFSCSNGVPIRLKCPDGLYFNDLYDVCDWPNEDTKRKCKKSYLRHQWEKKCNIVTVVTKEDGSRTTIIDEQFREATTCIEVLPETPNAVADCSDIDPCPGGTCFE